MVRLPLTIEHCLLGFLRQEPMHGYELRQRLADPAALGGVWRLKQSQLYALLGRLEEEGYVTATLQPQEARPPRKVYRLTRTGADAFNDWVRAPVLHGRQIRLEFLAKLYFARQTGEATARQLLDRQRAAGQDWLAAQDTRAGEVRETQPYEWLVCQFRIGQIQAMLNWLDLCEGGLTEAAAPTEKP